MARLYWIDSNSLIEPAKGPYAFTRVPQVWTFLADQAKAGIVGSSELVLAELKGSDPTKTDELQQWATDLGSTLFLPVDDEVQRAYARVANSVQGTERYRPQHVAPFLDKADAWLIAHAMVHGGRIVTHEVPEQPGSGRPKIPTVAERFGVGCLTLWHMLDELNWVA